MSPDRWRIVPDVGLDPAAVERIDTVSKRHGHAVWRLVTAERSYVLKWLGRGSARVEIESYQLLRRLGVPTLPLYGSSAGALLLEDLERSPAWRLAGEADLGRAEVGRAVAHWYRVFHDAGQALLTQGPRPDFLTRESDVLDPETVIGTGRALHLSRFSVWELAADHVELLKAAVERLSLTLNYNDFHWTNLALSSPQGEELEVLVFDYHLLGMGMRYSDVRNVVGSLSGGAPGAFRDAYGAIDPLEETLDRPLATLHNLAMAARMAELPKWARASRERVVRGDLERDLLEAILLARALLG